MQAAQLWHDWAMIQGCLDDEQLLQQQQTAAQTVVQWQHPPPGYLKCNVDASFYDAAATTGWGWCLRDCRVRFILAGTNLMHTKLNTLEGEAMALKEALEEMMQKGLSYVIFESDSKVVVDAIHSRQVGLSEFSILISHIKSLLLLNNNFEVKFVKRQANMVAHSLARAAYSMSGRRLFESIPRCIDNYLINEMH
ncbi:hypothetical protein TSUD_339990 [Trifolium subterraneum]|nr:hypothetical protein TSUD_339990 [Trifolium subterraneum]